MASFLPLLGFKMTFLSTVIIVLFAICMIYIAINILCCITLILTDFIKKYCSNSIIYCSRIISNAMLYICHIPACVSHLINRNYCMKCRQKKKIKPTETLSCIVIQNPSGIISLGIPSKKLNI